MTKAAGSRAPKKILVVDDDPAILGMLDIRLGKRGYHVISAADGEQALVQARKEKPGLSCST